MGIKFGMTVIDRITNFEGVVTGKTSYITGCRQFLVQPPVDEKGAWVEPRWIDEDRLEVDASTPRVKIKVETDGPDKAAPIR